MPEPRAGDDVCTSVYKEGSMTFRCHTRGPHDTHLGTAPGRVREWTDEQAFSIVKETWRG